MSCSASNALSRIAGTLDAPSVRDQAARVTNNPASSRFAGQSAASLDDDVAQFQKQGLSVPPLQQARPDSGSRPPASISMEAAWAAASPRSNADAHRAAFLRDPLGVGPAIHMRAEIDSSGRYLTTIPVDRSHTRQLSKAEWIPIEGRANEAVYRDALQAQLRGLNKEIEGYRSDLLVGTPRNERERALMNEINSRHTTHPISQSHISFVADLLGRRDLVQKQIVDLERNVKAKL